MKFNIEELRKKAESSWEGCHGCDDNDKNMWINGYITGVLSNQIEPPIDEEIEKYFKWGYGGDSGSAIYGAKWMKEMILNQSK